MSGENLESQAAAEGEDCPPVENEPIRSASDLEQEKRTAQEFFAQGNIGSYQIFVNQLGTLNMDSRHRQSVPTEEKPDQTYQLYIPKDCAEFVEHYKNSEYLAIAIVLSSFEAVRLSDLPELIEQLMSLLPAAGQEEEVSPVQAPYISTNTVLSAIGGERFTTEEGQLYVGLGEHSRQTLQNFWEQFPILRDPICKWLVQVSRIYPFRTAFDASQMVGAFARVISMDFEDGCRRVFSRLYSNRDSAGLLGNTMCRLYEDRTLRPKLDDLLLSWLCSDGSWLWRPACLACVFLWPELDHDRFAPSLRYAVSKRLAQLKKGDCAFLAVLLMQSEYFRTLLSELLGQAVQRAEKRADGLAAAQTYLFLLRRCYYLVDDRCPELPLAVCDTKKQQQNLTPVLREVISLSALRRQLYAILRAYLKEMDQYPGSEQAFRHLCAYFLNMAIAEPDDRWDILQFLKECEGAVARRVYEWAVRRY